MDLRHLRYFVTLADTLHFGRAAEQLSVTQPTLSHQIHALEEQVGTRLFNRVGRKVQLAPAGEIFKLHAVRALNEMQCAVHAISDTSGQTKGKLSIGVFQSFNRHVLPPILARFHTLYPGIHVVVRELQKKEIEQSILNGDLDIGIAYLPAISQNIETESLFEESYVLIVGKQHALYGRKKLSISMVSEYPLVLVTREFPLRQLIDSVFGTLATKPKVVMEMNSTQAILETVARSDLATILAKRRKTNSGIHCISLVPALTRTAAILWRRGTRRSGVATEICDMIKSACGAHAADEAICSGSDMVRLRKVAVCN